MTERQLFMIVVWITLALGLALNHRCAAAPTMHYQNSGSNEGQWSDPRLEQRLLKAIGEE